MQTQIAHSPETSPILHRFKGVEITETEDGFAWAEGGYFGTLTECRDDIKEFWAAEARYENPPDDTPCLDAPWWEQR